MSVARRRRRLKRCDNKARRRHCHRYGDTGTPTRDVSSSTLHGLLPARRHVIVPCVDELAMSQLVIRVIEHEFVSGFRDGFMGEKARLTCVKCCLI